MAISWVAALRLYAKQTGHYILPKKGSEAYEAVKKLQAETEHSAEHEVAKRGSGKKAMAKAAKSAKSAASASLEASAPGITSGKVSKKKAPTGYGGAEESETRSGDPVLPPAAKTKQIDNQGVAEKSKKVINPESEPEKVVKKGVSRTGKTVKANTADFINNENTGVTAAVSAQLAGQKEEIVKALKKAKRTPKVVTVGEGQEETIDNMKTDDPKAITGAQPFSIQALRNRLLC